MFHREADSGERRAARDYERGRGAAERSGRSDPVATLQRSVGNQGIQQLVTEGAIQPNLTVSPSSGPAEREAETVAEDVPSQRRPAGVTGGPSRDGESASRTATSIHEYSPKRAWKRQRRDEAQIVDVRPPSEFRRGHIPGAKNVPAPEMSSWVSEVGTGEEIVACCRTGRRSERVARQLSSGAGPTLGNLRGGYEAWDSSDGDEPLPVPHESPDGTSDHSEDESRHGMTAPDCWDSSWADWDWHHGGMTIVNRDNCCTRECTQQHEQRHIDDLEDCFNRAAKEFQEAKRKLPVKSRFRRWYKNGVEDWTECNAYGEGLRCTRQLRRDHDCESQSSECCYAIDYSLDFGEAQFRRYCSSAPNSPPPCPF